MIRDLVALIMKSADAMCTTPYKSDEKEYRAFNKDEAGAVILDEAGAMLQVDALLAWGGGWLPYLCDGRRRQAAAPDSNVGQRQARGAFRQCILQAVQAVHAWESSAGWLGVIGAEDGPRLRFEERVSCEVLRLA
ncbi:hypothetical protein IMZ48_03575, partial [Candidatus Bathyarchaeota archaeon]|nr:hypothetical protein [Candidatus Bathyarchaeota archaeon]